jgi:putative peptide zinc metalloprotease protein
MNKQEAYKNIEFFKKEFDNKFLLLNKNKTLSVGFLVKDILLSLQDGIFSPIEIKNELSKKHNLTIDINDIKETINVIDKFTFENTDSFFIKIFKLINPSRINLNLNFIFNRMIFYYSFTSILLLNFLIFIRLQYTHIEGIKNWLIWLSLLVFILFFHELGHSLAAKKYGVKCKEIGIGLYIVFPILYTNLGESWKLRKNKRIIINLSGIYFQLILGSIIGFLACITKSGVLSFLFFSNASIILFNINPFIKLDGYWVITDLLNTNDLTKVANNEMDHIFHLKSKKKRNIYLLIYASFRLIFITAMLVLMLNLLFSIIMKVCKFTPLSFHEYLFIIIILFYIFKHLKNRKCTYKLKNRDS